MSGKLCGMLMSDPKPYIRLVLMYVHGRDVAPARPHLRGCARTSGAASASTAEPVSADADAYSGLLGIFIRDERGYTTISVAVVLLVSLCLIFGLSSVHYLSSRAADVQEVADATAQAGANCVAAFSTIVQVLDAAVLSLGLTGMLVFAVGLIVSAIPILRAFAPPIIACAHRIFTARQAFARSAYAGIAKFEKALPYIIAYNAASCAYANSTEHIPYVGIAVPYPLTSKSDFSAALQDISDDAMKDSAEKLEKKTKEQEEHQKKADDAKRRAWRADCVDNPSCMRSRAAKLASLSGASNQQYSFEAWTFECARARAQAYYAARMQQDIPNGASSDEYIKSCARKRFYAFAYSAVATAHCNEGPPVDISLPNLPYNKQMVRASTLYSERVWPACVQHGKLVAYCAAEKMPAAPSAWVSLADIEAGRAVPDAKYGIRLTDMGRVAAASTSITNGFEHYWREVVRSASVYQNEMNAAQELERQKKDDAKHASDAFSKALNLIGVARPTYCPPGAYGCISFVSRTSQLALPDSLTSTFVPAATLPSGIAIAGATLAPDGSADNNDVLKHMADGIEQERFPLTAALIGGICSIWSKLLVGYGSAYKHLESIANSVMGGISAGGGGFVASWLSSKISQTISAFGFKPGDTRLRKPVRIHTQHILSRAGKSGVAEMRRYITTMPSDAESIKARSLAAVKELLGDNFTLANLPALGSDKKIPLTINVHALMAHE